jgi:hypothetical protein
MKLYLTLGLIIGWVVCAVIVALFTDIAVSISFQILQTIVDIFPNIYNKLEMFWLDANNIGKFIILALTYNNLYCFVIAPIICIAGISYTKK